MLYRIGLKRTNEPESSPSAKKPGRKDPPRQSHNRNFPGTGLTPNRRRVDRGQHSHQPTLGCGDFIFVGEWGLMIQRYPQGLAAGGRTGYLHQRRLRSAKLIEHMRSGYAPGGCSRTWLTQLGYPATSSASSRLRLCSRLRHLHASHCIPARRQSQRAQYLSFGATSPLHRFLPGTKSGLYAWEQVRQYEEVILLDGRFDYSVLRHQWAKRGQDYEGVCSEEPRAPARLDPTAGDDQSVAAMAKS